MDPVSWLQLQSSHLENGSLRRFEELCEEVRVSFGPPLAGGGHEAPDIELLWGAGGDHSSGWSGGHTVTELGLRGAWCVALAHTSTSLCNHILVLS